MILWFAVIASKYLFPLTESRILSPQHGRIEVGLYPSRAGPPDVEVAISACLKDEKHNNQQPNQQQRERGCLRMGKCNRESEAQPCHCPIRCVVKTGAPDGAAIDFAPIQMRKCTDFCCSELVNG